MHEKPVTENDFLSQLTEIVGKNISNEQFGVSELADAMNMSRSNLLRKVKKDTKLSVSQLINQIRLKHAMDLLRKTSLNVSEVSHQVGFNSTSYFIKCFREYYGYPPGEVGKRSADPQQAISDPPKSNKRKYLILASAAIAGVVIALLGYYGFSSSGENRVDKSIAVLPFKNDSNDSSNVYLINGLMESTLNNLQQIKGLKVTSRTSAEKYRNTSKSIPEMAGELNVRYFVEGSGQKIGDQILLNIQLIDGTTDRHLWGKQYRRQAKDIFQLQEEIARNIAEEIEVVITPEVEERIEKKPTDNLVAYDYFLKGRDLFYRSGPNDLLAAIPLFQKAIEADDQFAMAYANLVMVYYYLDIFKVEKKYTNDIISYADKALLLDSKLEESLIAKGLAYAHQKQYALAVPYLEKALEYNPNHGLVIHFLTEFYSIHLHDISKYLEYSLKGVQVDGASTDSSTASFKHFHLANSLIQAGFIDEALAEVNRSLAYNQNAPFAGYLKSYILFAKNKDLKETHESLMNVLAKDTMRFDILQEVGRVYFYMGDYKTAYKYYKRFLTLRDMMKLDLFQIENLKIGIVLGKMGEHEKSEALIKSFKDYAENDRTIYKHLHLASYYAYKGDVEKGMEHLKLFSKEDEYAYWVVMMDLQPDLNALKSHPDFKKVLQEINSKFWKHHEEIKNSLKERGLLELISATSQK